MTDKEQEKEILMDMKEKVEKNIMDEEFKKEVFANEENILIS